MEQEESLETISVQDDWKAVVVFAVPNQIEDVQHCSVLSESIATGLRKRFSVVEYDALLKEIKDLAHGKVGKVKMSKPPPFFEVIDSIKVLIEQGEDVPASLLAKLLKFKLLMIKQKEFERREEEKKAAEAAAKQAKLEERSRSNAGSSPGKRSKSQSPGRKKGKRDDAPASPKKDTKLKRRGELEDTFKTIDDEPDGTDDPSHYVVITSIYEPRVFQQLIDIGVGIDAVIRVTSQTYETKDMGEVSKADEKQEEAEDENNEAEKENDEETKKAEEKLKEKLQKFWRDSETIIQEAASGTRIKDIAKLSVVIKDSIVPEGEVNNLEQDKKTDYGTKLFELAANLCYDLLDSKKRYKRYIDNLKMTHIPLLKETARSVPLTSSVASAGGLETATGMRQASAKYVDMRYYNHLMDQVPTESHSVPLLLDSLLRQVEATVDEKDPMDDPLPPREDQLDHMLGQYIDSKLEVLGLRKPVPQSDGSENVSSKPLLIHHGDERTQRTHHLNRMQDVSPNEAEDSVYKLHSVASMIHHFANAEDDKKQILTRKQQLAHCCNMLDNQSKFDKVMALMALEVLPLKHVDCNGEVSHPHDDESSVHIGWDDPYIIQKEFQDADAGPSIDEDRAISEIRDLSRLRDLSEYQYSEHFDSKIFLQVLDKAMDLRPFMDMYYHSGLSSLFLVLHNPKSDLMRNCSSWETWLHSNVGFRNYLEHVSDEIDDWQREEDTKEEIRNRPVTPDAPPREPTPVPVKTGSSHKLITRAEMLEMKEAEDDKSKKKNRKSRAQSRSPGKRPPSESKKAHSPDKREKTSSAMKRTPSARKTASRAGTARKSLKSHQEKKPEQEEEHNADAEQEGEKEYAFHGYDVGDELVHVSGETSYLFPCDGDLIKVEKSGYINGNTSIRTAVYNSDNTIVLNIKNPVLQSKEGNKVDSIDASWNMSLLSKQDISNNEEEGQEAGEENEYLRLISQIPPLPEITDPCFEDSFLTINCKDGMRLGIDCRTSTAWRRRLEQLSSSLVDAKNAVYKLPVLGGNNNPVNPKGNSPKGKRNKEDEMKRQEELERQQEKETRDKIEYAISDVCQMRRSHLSTCNLSVSCPDGLQLTFLHDEIKNGDFSRVLHVRQEYVVKGCGKHSCEKTRTKVSEESSRLVTMTGTVVKYMRDGSVEILFADGAVSSCPSIVSPVFKNKPADVIDPNASLASDSGSNLKKLGVNLKQVVENAEDSMETNSFEWFLVNASGEKYHRTSEEVRLQDLIVSRAVCPRTNQVVETREDGVVTVKRPDNTTIVEHSDGTRITSYFEEFAFGTDNETGEEEVRPHAPMECVKIECVGYATVLINKVKKEIKTVFGNGSVITASLNGEYKIAKPDSSTVFVNDKGETLFVPKKTVPDIASYNAGNLASLFNYIDEHGSPSGVYVIKPSSNNCLSAVDDLGNSFSVSAMGEAVVERGQDLLGVKDLLKPRYFVLHKDGSGEELLRQADISTYLEEAETDPGVAVLKSSAKNQTDVSGITVLRPFKGTNSDIWLMQKDEEDIIPSDLKERDFKTLPAKEVKSPGPIFGSNAGVAFQVATKPTPVPPQPPRSCPNVLEMRYITHFSGLTPEDRKKMLEGIENYRRLFKEQLALEKDLLPNDPRSVEEKNNAQELLEKFKDMMVKEEQVQGNLTKPAIPDSSLGQEYLEATRVPPPPPAERAKPQRLEKEWEKDKIEIAELKYAKEALRSGKVPPYFDTEEGQRFLYAIKGQPELERLASDLAKETVHPSYRPVSATSTESNGITPELSTMSHPSGEFYDLRKQNHVENQESNSVEFFDSSRKDSPANSKLSLTRPGNPTPAEAINGDSGLGIHRDTQSRSRPYNPTPLHAGKNSSHVKMENSIEEMPESREHHVERDENLLQTTLRKQQLQETGPFNDELSQAYIMTPNREFAIDTQFGDQSPRYSSLTYSVTGDPRKEAVRLPASIKGSKPGALPNHKFMNIEEPVRRQVKTASIAGAVKPETTSRLRGFQLHPDLVDFGVLKEGVSYSQTVMLKNVGIDNCRFKVKQPPPSTGLKVIYTPGPVAAGMATRLDVEIFAVAVGVEGSSGVGSINHYIEIISETDNLYLPVTAAILTSHEYDNRSETSPRGGPSVNTLVLSNRPSSRDAITRPRKD
ncbi:sperm-associated antigen 17-like isoform X2 [Rhopilema esculentum]|uniref:sperm-associated antigen 17-like isoform X2 n=1 Tax=Rhopilema esculentum TaxID=499914 RepID=UPI0031D105D5